MSYHIRGEWTNEPPAGPVWGAPPIGVAIHWQGVFVTPDRPTAYHLRADWRYHTQVKGWVDIAYNLGVDLAGDVWEARGLNRRSGANGSDAANRSYLAIVFLLGPGQVPTEAMYQGGREAVALCRRAHPKALAIRTHNDVRPQPTQCPGAELTAAVRSGRLDPGGIPPHPPSVHGEDEMLAALDYIDRRYREVVKREPDNVGLASWLKAFDTAANHIDVKNRPLHVVAVRNELETALRREAGA